MFRSRPSYIGFKSKNIIRTIMAQAKTAHPDADIHPVATGLAKHTVDAHTDPKPLKLYAGWFCPFVQRPWAVLEEKGIPYEYIEVNPYNKPESLLKLNPRGLVPTLQVHDKPLFESNVLCEYLEEAYQGYGPDLRPKDLYQRARMRIWSDWITSRFIPGFFRFMQCSPDEDGGKALEARRGEFLAYIKEFTNEMDENGPFFFGEQPQMIDFIMAPWVVRLWGFDHLKGGLGVPAEGQGGDEKKVWARWRKYAKAIEERESIKKTTSEREPYLPMLRRYAENKAQSELAKAIRSGKSVP